MPEPKSITFKTEWSGSGITIEYIKRRKVIRVSGWFDSFVGIPGGEMPLDEFLQVLGIKER